MLLAALDALDALRAVRERARAEVMRVARASAPLLSRRQPDAVQAAALALHRRLAALNADAIWLVWAAVGGAAVEGAVGGVWAELRPVEDFTANAALALDGVAEVDRAAAPATVARESLRRPALASTAAAPGRDGRSHRSSTV